MYYEKHRLWGDNLHDNIVNVGNDFDDIACYDNPEDAWIELIDSTKDIIQEEHPLLQLT